MKMKHDMFFHSNIITLSLQFSAELLKRGGV